ncbi:MAG TPA: hypothetical protein VIY86_04575, partial [Pirellulaceae bacterium]
RRADLEAFGESIFAYGLEAGACFAAVQGGPFASQSLADCVARLRARGVRGCGQSSWGPVVFAVVGSEVEARELLRDVAQFPGNEPLESWIARPDNDGARVQILV